MVFITQRKSWTVLGEADREVFLNLSDQNDVCLGDEEAEHGHTEMGKGLTALRDKCSPHDVLFSLDSQLLPHKVRSREQEMGSKEPSQTGCLSSNKSSSTY